MLSLVRPSPPLYEPVCGVGVCVEGVGCVWKAKQSARKDCTVWVGRKWERITHDPNRRTSPQIKIFKYFIVNRSQKHKVSQGIVIARIEQNCIYLQTQYLLNRESFGPHSLWHTVTNVLVISSILQLHTHDRTHSNVEPISWLVDEI